MLYLQSQGEIDTNALCLMGASVKGDDAIGEFGSGLKYAIACLIRERIDFTIYSGLRPILITTETETFRGSEFCVICVDGKRTSITSRTGPKWGPREALRELWSNALDEGGAAISEGLIPPSAGFTTVAIASHPILNNMWENWGQYFLPSIQPLFSGPAGSIHEQLTPNFFRKGVWIVQDRVNLLFSYNFNEANSPSLPESRLVGTSTCSIYLAYLLRHCDNPRVAEKLLENAHREDCSEWVTLGSFGNLNGDALPSTLSSVFNQRYTHIGALSNKQTLKERLNSGHSVLWCASSAYTYLSLKCKLPQIETAVNYDDAFTASPWPIGAKEILDERLRFLAANGITFPTGTCFEYATFKNKEMIAQADMFRGRCLLSASALEPQNLTIALIEEWTHLKHRVLDHTVAQQHVYLNLISDLLKRASCA